MNFTEDLFLLSCDTDTARLYPLPAKLYNLVIGSALLFDLSFRGIINDDWEKIEILEYEQINENILSEAVNSLAIFNTKFTLSEALTIIASRGETFKEILISELIKKKHIRHEKSHIFKRWNDQKYYVTNPDQKSKLISRIREAILTDIIPDPEICAMISLIKASGLDSYLFDSTELSNYKNRISFLANMESLGRILQLEIDQLKDKDLEKFST